MWGMSMWRVAMFLPKSLGWLRENLLLQLFEHFGVDAILLTEVWFIRRAAEARVMFDCAVGMGMAHCVETGDERNLQRWRHAELVRFAT
jgi:hypothetical protein